MKTALFWLLALPAAVMICRPQSFAAIPVAVFDFQTDGNAAAQMGGGEAGSKAAMLVAADLSDLAPLGAVHGDALRQRLGAEKVDLAGPLTAGEAKRVGAAAGAAALVNGHIYAAGSEIILAAKVVAAATGQTLGTMVKGQKSAPLADLFAQLSMQIGRIVLLQQGLAAPAWAPAVIVGTGKPGSLFAEGEIACVMGIDGVAIPDETRNWSRPQALRPGRHQIHVRYLNHTLADCNLIFDALPGGSYAVAYVPEPQRQVRLWIQDQALHRPVSRIVETTLPAMTSSELYLPQFDPRGLPTYH